MSVNVPINVFLLSPPITSEAINRFSLKLGMNGMIRGQLCIYLLIFYSWQSEERSFRTCYFAVAAVRYNAGQWRCTTIHITLGKSKSWTRVQT